MSNNENVFVDDLTGQVFGAPKFRSMWCNPFGCIQEDCSNQYAEIFEEIAPFALDPKTGKLLNNSSTPKLISKGKINIWEKIQSYRDEADLYKILEKFAYSNDASLLNARPCSYGDISNIPDNLNDYTAFVNAHMNNLKSLAPELAKKVIDDSYTAEDVEAAASAIYKSRVDALNKSNESEDKK